MSDWFTLSLFPSIRETQLWAEELLSSSEAGSKLEPEDNGPIMSAADEVILGDDLAPDIRDFISSQYYISIVSDDPSKFDLVPEDLRSDRDFLLRVVGRNHQVYNQLDESLRNDPDFVSRLVFRDWHILSVIDRDVLMHEDVSAEAFRQNPWILDITDDSELSMNILRLFARQGIRTTERFEGMSLVRLVTLMADCLGEADDRPLALLVYAPDPQRGRDWRNREAFFDVGQKIADLQSRGFRVVYTEAETDTELYEAIRQYGETQLVDLLIIGGHGEPDNMELSRHPGERYQLDLSDREEMLRLELSDYLVEYAFIVLDGCSTGRGEHRRDNLANMVADVFPLSGVHAATGTITGYNIVWAQGMMMMGSPSMPLFVDFLGCNNGGPCSYHALSEGEEEEG